MRSSNTCDSCHITSNWTIISGVDHGDILQGTCDDCHNSGTAYGIEKHVRHIPSSEECDNCHFNAGGVWTGATDQESVQADSVQASAQSVQAGAIAEAELVVTAKQQPVLVNDIADEAIVIDTVGKETNIIVQQAERLVSASNDSFEQQLIHPDVSDNCVSCHNGTVAMAKKANHFKTTEQCYLCHQIGSWSPVSHFDHTAALGLCSSCHNGHQASGQPIRHINTLKACEDCHNENNWAPVSRVDHAAVLGSCFSCHNRKQAEGKPFKHISSDNHCDNCHITNIWSQVVMDHSNVTGSCSLCHNGTSANAKTATHITTTNTCNDCHRRRTWTPVYRVDHLSVTGSCSSCHNGKAADGKPANHPGTHNTCEDCHRSNLWSHVTFNHDNLTGSCSSCHAVDYKQQYHKKTIGPNPVYYSVNELSNCAGSCHVYKDKTFSSISQRRRGPDHRPFRGAW